MCVTMRITVFFFLRDYLLSVVCKWINDLFLWHMFPKQFQKHILCNIIGNKHPAHRTYMSLYRHRYTNYYKLTLCRFCLHICTVYKEFGSICKLYSCLYYALASITTPTCCVWELFKKVFCLSHIKTEKLIKR